eukprot:753038-Hanusia_phi.AAC.6
MGGWSGSGGGVEKARRGGVLPIPCIGDVCKTILAHRVTWVGYYFIGQAWVGCFSGGYSGVGTSSRGLGSFEGVIKIEALTCM